MSGDGTLQELFAPHGSLAPEVLGELRSMMRLYSVDAEELFMKWEAYSLKMTGGGARGGANDGGDLVLDVKTARDFKKDIQDALERENRSKVAHMKGTPAARRAGATPKASMASDGVYGMLDGIVPNTPRPAALSAVNGNATKRKSNFETPAAKATKNYLGSSPADSKTPDAHTQLIFNRDVPFSSRPNAGEITQSLNDNIEIPAPPTVPQPKPRIKLTANMDQPKFAYKTMAMKLSEASETLDDRIDEFRALLAAAHGLGPDAFGNPAAQSTAEIVAVGRICSDYVGGDPRGAGKLNAASLLLETSRRNGNGYRVPLKVDKLPGYDFFPGKIVALRGTNASGEFFAASEELSLPLMDRSVVSQADLEGHVARLGTVPAGDDEDEARPYPLTTLVASGPYTPSSSLDYSALHELLSTAVTKRADLLILTGPFLDIEHPCVRSGELPELPPHITGGDPDAANLAAVFKHLISTPINQAVQNHPGMQVILIPSPRDAVAHHVAFPQDRLPKRELGLHRGTSCVVNPATLIVNEAVVAVGAVDTLDMLRREECVSGVKKAEHIFERAARNIIQQRSFCPVWPPTGRGALVPGLEKVDVRGRVDESGNTIEGKEGEEGETEANYELDLPVGTMLDTTYLNLASWTNTLPDLLVLPSVVTPFVRVVDGVVVVNPGTLSKRKGAGTFAHLTMLPREISDEERESGKMCGANLPSRARVDIVRI
ncbi:DNA polymerase alpha subunit B N-terminal-domain-containing protein [Lineolata rhizophorae]|uniref:DNA polymerase alpha subunit B n=1 Tax=Lineolata rhizophorae TaxID=578093 RepID=A0A6A6NPN2_9PEZI|nr:DNA polymerase alpha subunit B N-terminal-domain-containing protein [Lineolata rhizophorae]